MKIDDELQELKKKHPNHCKTLTVTDSNGVVRELIFPKALDLDRPKRPRTNFTPEQLQILEDEFDRNQYLVGKDRNELSKRLKLSETQVKIWFQNRRTKYKKDQNKPDDLGEDAEESQAERKVVQVVEQKVQREKNMAVAPSGASKKSVGNKRKKYFDDFDDESSVDSFLLDSPSPDLPTIQPPLLPGLALPPTLPALAGSNYHHHQQQSSTLWPWQQHLSDASSRPNITSTPLVPSSPYSPPSTSTGSATSTLLHQKLCATIGAALATPSVHIPNVLSSANCLSSAIKSHPKFDLTEQICSVGSSTFLSLFNSTLSDPSIVTNKDAPSSNSGNNNPANQWNLILP